jgi:hypothetical protein
MGNFPLSKTRDLFSFCDQVMDENKSKAYMVAFIELESNLRCQLYMQPGRPAGTFPGMLRKTDDGVHALLLIYATKGIPVGQLLEVDYSTFTSA